MDLNLFLSPPLHSIITIFFILILVQTFYCQDYEQYMQCTRPFQCGILTDVQYPFWGNNRSSLCGHKGFKLYCEQYQYPEIYIDSLRFRVLNIIQSGHRMTIARMDLFDDLYRPERFNTTLDYDLFDYTDRTIQNLTLFYNCPILGPISNKYPSCPMTIYNVHYLNGENHPDIFVACEYNIKVPVLNTTLDMLSNSSLGLGEVLHMGFDVEHSAGVKVCEACSKSGGSCVNNSSLCLCGDTIQHLVCPPRVSNRASVKLFIGILVGVSGLLGILLTYIIFCCFRRMKSSISSMAFFKKITKNDKDLEAFIRSYGIQSLKRYNFSRVKKMTNSFKDKLGQGGFGGVYKGKLLDGRLVAVKVLNASKGNGEEFINEIASISRTSHVNIVTLLGFCLEGRKRALIYEFMPSGSLEKFIHNDITLKASYHLGWEKLYQIAIGIGRGLEYLHRGCNTKILHFDIKPHNILLDEDFCPKISDFGLAKLCTRKESMISMLEARGTIGYIAPEVFSRNFGSVSHKSDVYSYGMMVLEMVGGRKNINVDVNHTSELYFPHWIYKRLELGNEFELHGVTSIEETEMVRKMVLVGLWCIQTNPLNRPSISKVIEMLEGSIRALDIPPKPFLSSPLWSPPPRLPSDSSITSMS